MGGWGDFEVGEGGEDADDGAEVDIGCEVGAGEHACDGAADGEEDEESFGVWDEGGEHEAAGEGDGGV